VLEWWIAHHIEGRRTRVHYSHTEFALR
jgi:hypothetical protein